MAFVSQALHTHMFLIYFVYGLAYFTMGVAVALESRRTTTIKLATALPFLASFGILHGLVEWTDMFLLIRIQVMGSAGAFVVELPRVFVLAISVYCLFQFGANLLASTDGRYSWVRHLPLYTLALWFALILWHLYFHVENVNEWLVTADDLARYTLYLPGGILAGLALIKQASVFRAMKLPRVSRDCWYGAAAFLFSSLCAGLVVPAGNFLPASILNYDSFFSVVGVPVQLFRGSSAIFITYFVLRILRVFEVEYGRQLEDAHLQRFEAQQQALEVERRTQREMESRNRQLGQRTRELTALFEVSKTLTSTLNLDALLDQVVAQLVTIIGSAEGASFQLYDTRQGSLIQKSATGYDHEYLAGVIMRPGEGIAGKVFSTRQPMLLATPEKVREALADLTEENKKNYRRACAGVEHPCSVICVPLIARDKAIGALSVANFRGPAAFSESDLTLLQGIADEVAMAVENAYLYEELQRKDELRGELLQKVITAQEEERKRIARELHDEIGQAITALIISLKAAEEGVRRNPATVAKMLEEAKDLTTRTLDEIHKLMVDLRPTVLDDLGLIPALRWYTKSQLERSNLEVQLEVTGKKGRLPAQVETVLFRIVQEAVTNIVKHARTNKALVKLELKESSAELLIEDSGRGFDAGQVTASKGKRQGLGLLGMKERVTLLGGDLRIESRPSQGTRLTIQVPWELGDG